MAAQGHEDAFPSPRLSGRCRFSQETFAGTRGNGEDAPIPVVRDHNGTAAVDPFRTFDRGNEIKGHWRPKAQGTWDAPYLPQNF
jgi:hypothetical protein